MKRFTVTLVILCLSLVAMVSSFYVKADEWNKKTILTFNQPVEVPGGIVLPAGTYVFMLVDSLSDRHIVRIFNQEQTYIFATILAIPNYRLRATDKTVMTFKEREANSPEAIRAWFYPGANWGEEFVYPKTRAIELAKTTRVPVLAMPAELEPVISAKTTSVDEQPVAALKFAPLKAIKPTGEEVEVAEVVENPPAQTKTDQTIASLDTKKPIKHLPQTASQLPLLALIGLMSLTAGCGLLVITKRHCLITSISIEKRTQ